MVWVVWATIYPSVWGNDCAAQQEIAVRSELRGAHFLSNYSYMILKLLSSDCHGM